MLTLFSKQEVIIGFVEDVFIAVSKERLEV
jgi:hypothetical protein